jgi:hypothetical protein
VSSPLAPSTPGRAKVLAEKKKSARELLKTVREALPRLEREAAQEAIAAGEPWPPPKENGEW